MHKNTATVEAKVDPAETTSAPYQFTRTVAALFRAAEACALASAEQSKLPYIDNRGMARDLLIASTDAFRLACSPEAAWPEAAERYYLRRLLRGSGGKAPSNDPGNPLGA